MTKKILFIGLGRMGFPMAGHLAQSSKYDVYVHNRSPEKIKNWCDQYTGKPHESSVCYDYIILCVGNDNDVTEMLSSNSGFINCVKKDTIVIDHTTTSANLAKLQHERLAALNVHFIDAPVSGGEAGAINGQLSAMVGGDVDAIVRSTELLNTYCKSVVRIGDSGAGQVAKMANQLSIAGVLTGLSEAMLLIEKSGVNAENVYQAIKNGAAQSWQLDNRFQTMINGEFDFGFAIEHMIKDLNYAVDTAHDQQWQPRNSEAVITQYQELLSNGFSGNDTSVLVEYLRNKHKD